METTSQTRRIESKFVSDCGDLVKELTSFKKPLYINKQSTGMGVTTVFLNCLDKNILILSPNVGMVQSKEQQGKYGHVSYIYGSAGGAWGMARDMVSKGKHVNINATADNFIALRKNNQELYKDLLSKFYIVIDEWHAIYNNDYSETLPELYQIILESPLSYVVTTGTSIYPELEVPTEVEILNIAHKNPELKEVTVAVRQEGSDLTNNLIARHISDCLKLKLKPCISTNDARRVGVCSHLTKEILAGEKMNAKAKLRANVNEVKEIGDAEVAFFSTRYNTGSDFYGDVSINVIADGYSKVDNKSIQEVIQSLGRAREGYQNARIIYKPVNGLRTVSSIISDIKQNDRNDKMYAFNTRDLFKELQMVQTYTSVDSFVNNLKGYGITPKIEDQGDYVSMPQSSALIPSIKYLMSHEIEVIEKSFKHVLNNIQGDAVDTFLYEEKVVTSYLVWKLIHLGVVELEELESYHNIKKTDRIIPYILKQVNDKRIEVVQCLEWLKIINAKKKVKKICKTETKLEVQDEEYLRRWVLSNVSINRRFKDAVLNEINKIVGGSDKHIEKFGHNGVNAGITIATGNTNKLLMKDVKKNILRNIKSDMKRLEIPFDDSISERYNKVSDSLTKQLREGSSLNKVIYLLSHDKDYYIKRFDWFGKYLFCTKYGLFKTGFKVTHKDNREYNPATKVPKIFKKFTSIQFYEYDIISANPTIIDNLTNSNLAGSIYSNIMVKNECSRNQAKVIYNRALNNHFDRNRFKTLKEFGYSNEAAAHIANLGSKKGELFKLITSIEAGLIFDFQINNEMDIYNTIRVHDGIICFEKQYQLTQDAGVTFSESCNF